MKELEKYLLKRVTVISGFLEIPKESFTTETIHDLRVEIKKLHALFELLEHCHDNFKMKRLFKPFRHLFRQTGKVREIQVEEELLKMNFENNLPSNYMQKNKALMVRE
jgi:CHAD domain-containing protein